VDERPRDGRGHRWTRLTLDLLIFSVCVFMIYQLLVYLPSRFDAQPPSLYVTLAPGSWEGLGEGRSVARWLKVRGVEMIRHGEGPAGP
jgi:hypothetical protein